MGLFGCLQFFYIIWDSVGQILFSAYVSPTPSAWSKNFTQHEVRTSAIVTCCLSWGCCWFRVNPFQNVSMFSVILIWSHSSVNSKENSYFFNLVALLLVSFTLSLPELVPLTLFFLLHLHFSDSIAHWTSTPVSEKYPFPTLSHPLLPLFTVALHIHETLGCTTAPRRE